MQLLREARAAQETRLVDVAEGATRAVALQEMRRVRTTVIRISEFRFRCPSFSRFSHDLPDMWP